MRFRVSISKFLLAGLVAFLSACSGGSDLPEFTTDGVSAPEAKCTTSPDSFGEAESLGSVGTGICTVRDAWRVTSIDGVRFSQPAIVNCAVANGMRTWLATSILPAAQRIHGEKVVAVEVAASHACRGRNGQRGAKISEHAFGNAIDISGFTLADGTQLSVERDYHGSRFLKQVRQEACGTFKTVLGPGSDAHHHDHIHVDLAVRRSGQSYCH